MVMKKATPKQTTGFRAWKAVRDEVLSPEARARVDASVKQTLLEMDLKQLRDLSKASQTDVAESLETTQSQISRIEARDDHLVSTLRKYVEALGGTLEVVARFDDKAVRLRSV
jgi:hypothetical protein